MYLAPQRSISAQPMKARRKGCSLHILPHFIVDTKELFGSELHVLGAVDIKDAKIVRWIDYWDGDRFDANAYGQMRTAPDKFPSDFQEQKVGEDSSVQIRDVSVKLQRALSQGDAVAAAALFSPEATYEDRTLNTEILGPTD
jgi:hypothetical protein